MRARAVRAQRVVVAGVAAFAACGCARRDLPLGLGTSTRTVRAEEFAAGAGSPPQIAVQSASQSAPEIRVVTREVAEGGVIGIDDLPGSEPATEREYEEAAAMLRQTPAGGARYLVDAKVGDLNGRPIYARAWLEQIGDRLRARSAELPRAQWRALAENEIAERLRSELKDQLLLAEARASLTPQERAGLRAFLERFESDVVSGAAGSRTLAERQLAEERGITLEEARREREQVVLIQEQFRREIASRVQVPWRDIRLVYERNQSVFNPPPRAVFRQIRVRTADAGAIEQVGAALESGAPFDEVADLEVNERRDPVERELTGPFEEESFFGLDALNEAARGLVPGAWAGPIQAGAFTYWVFLKDVRSGTMSLYDAQLLIQDELYSRRLREEETKYLYKLIRRSGMEDFANIVKRLTDVAEVWYYQPRGTN
ncbi:MAG: hypothetical protein KIS87_04270 [Phycisphaeraceae bacterium]|nr:hypothetical protein [Phycisphaeraceae bacterium]